MCQVGNGAWEKGTTARVPAPKNRANDGLVPVRFNSVRTDGSVLSVQTVTVTIDTTPPAFAWGGVSPSASGSTGPVKRSCVVKDVSGRVHIKWTAADQRSFFAAGISRRPAPPRADERRFRSLPPRIRGGTLG